MEKKKKKNTGGRLTLEGIDTVFENVLIFLGYVIYFYNPVSVPQEKSGQKRQKKCIGSEMSEKTIGEVSFHFPEVQPYYFKRQLQIQRQKNLSQSDSFYIIFKNETRPNLKPKIKINIIKILANEHYKNYRQSGWLCTK
jgi:hypothetical protein